MSLHWIVLYIMKGWAISTLVCTVYCVVSSLCRTGFFRRRKKSNQQYGSGWRMYYNLLIIFRQALCTHYPCGWMAIDRKSSCCISGPCAPHGNQFVFSHYISLPLSPDYNMLHLTQDRVLALHVQRVSSSIMCLYRCHGSHGATSTCAKLPLHPHKLEFLTSYWWTLIPMIVFRTEKSPRISHNCSTHIEWKQKVIMCNTN